MVTASTARPRTIMSMALPGSARWRAASTYAVSGCEACEMIRSGGSAVIVSSTPVGSDLTIPRFFDFRSSGKNLRSSVYGSTRSRRDFQKLIDLAEAGRLDLESMVTRKIALDDFNGAFEAMDSGEVIRSVITRF